MTSMEVYSSYIKELYLQALTNVIVGIYQQSWYTLQTSRLFLGYSIDGTEVVYNDFDDYNLHRENCNLQNSVARKREISNFRKVIWIQSLKFYPHTNWK